MRADKSHRTHRNTTNILFPCFLAVLLGVRVDSSKGQLPPAMAERIQRVGLAISVQKTYRESKCLTFQARVRMGETFVRADTAMTPQGFKTSVFTADGLAAVYSFCGGRVQEFRPEWRGQRDVLIEYPSSLPPGSRDLLLEEGTDAFACLIGSLLESWLGQSSMIVDFFTQVIAYGRWIGFETVDGYKCATVRRIRDNLHEDTLFVDTRQFVIRRSVTRQLTPAGGLPIVRDRHYRALRLNACATEDDPCKTSAEGECSNATETRPQKVP
jgi:hypothetical protein